VKKFSIGGFKRELFSLLMLLNYQDTWVKRQVKLMEFNPITAIIAIAFLYPILRGFLFKFSSRHLKRDMIEIGSNISFVASLFLGVFFSKRIFLEHENGVYQDIYEVLPSVLTSYIDSHTLIFYVVVIPVMIMVIYKIINLVVDGISRIIFYPLIDGIEKSMEDKSNIFKRLTGAFFQLPKSVGYVLFIAFLINVLSMFNLTGNYNQYLESSQVYNLICREVVVPVTNSNLAKQLPSILDNSLKVVIKEADAAEFNNKTIENLGNKKVIVYYNGVTLEEGIKSNEKIDSFAKQIGSKGTTSKEKAKILYTWVGSNIEYDHEKANRVLDNDFGAESGAIPTFQSREGICFDYACLYAAMARANDLKVRIVTGEGFNGVSWVSHAWNQVYIPEEGKWISVDPTFYKGGNYFNSKRFDMDHRNAKIAGEW
jgi:hypothetical protein